MDCLSPTSPVQRVVFMKGAQVGAPLNAETPIPTPRGWRRMGELAPGDQVFGEAGRPYWVTGVSPVHRRSSPIGPVSRWSSPTGRASFATAGACGRSGTGARTMGLDAAPRPRCSSQRPPGALPWTRPRRFRDERRCAWSRGRGGASCPCAPCPRSRCAASRSPRRTVCSWPAGSWCQRTGGLALARSAHAQRYRTVSRHGPGGDKTSRDSTPALLLRYRTCSAILLAPSVLPLEYSSTHTCPSLTEPSSAIQPR
jgi:hypothetical protein